MIDLLTAGNNPLFSDAWQHYGVWEWHFFGSQEIHQQVSWCGILQVRMPPTDWFWVSEVPLLWKFTAVKLSRQTVSCYYLVDVTETMAFRTQPRVKAPSAEIGMGYLIVQMRLAQGNGTWGFPEGLPSVDPCLIYLSTFQMSHISCSIRRWITQWLSIWDSPCTLRLR